MPEGEHHTPTDRIDQLTERLERLEHRVSELEASGSADGTLDRYDATVLDRLEVGQTYGLGQLQAYYRKSGIRQDGTLKNRIQYLTSEFCERVGTQRWEFQGRD